MIAPRVWMLTGVAAAGVLMALALTAGAFMPIASFDGPHPGLTNNPQSHWNTTNATRYPVAFNETGLPSGTFWSVDLQRGWYGGYGSSGGVNQLRASWGWPGWNETNGSTVGFELRNGTYQFTIGEARNGNVTYVPTPGSGSVTVNGSGSNVSVSFAALTFDTVSFTETGLPNGTNWSVGVHSAWSWGGGWCGSWGRWHGGPIFAWNLSANSTIGFTLPNGTYDFHIGPVWAATGLYLPTPSEGNFTVNGSAVDVSVTFELLDVYNVTFTETGLANGTLWNAAVFNWTDGTFAHGSSNTSSITVAVPNGTYDFGVGAVWNGSALFVASPNFGNVTVSGTSVTVSVQFSVYTPSWSATAGRA